MGKQYTPISSSSSVGGRGGLVSPIRFAQPPYSPIDAKNGGSIYQHQSQHFDAIKHQPSPASSQFQSLAGMTSSTNLSSAHGLTTPTAPSCSSSSLSNTSTSIASSLSPTSLRNGLTLVASVARPVSAAAVQVFHTWLGAVSTGFRAAVRLRNDWRETMVARRQVRELREKYAAEKKEAKLREKQAMERLKQLETQLQTMQQQLLYQQTAHLASPTSPSAPTFVSSPTHSPPSSHSQSSTSSSSPAPVITASAIPIAPPMSSAFISPSAVGPATVPIAPPMTNTSFVPLAPSIAVVPTVTGSTKSSSGSLSRHVSKPNSASLILAAGQLKSITQTPAMARQAQAKAAAQAAINTPVPAATFTSTVNSIDMNMLRGVKLRSVPTRKSHGPCSSHPSSNGSNAAFLFDALKARFHRSGVAVRLPSQHRRSNIHTPIHSRMPRNESAFSPMTPHAEEPWTPAH